MKIIRIAIIITIWTLVVSVASVVITSRYYKNEITTYKLEQDYEWIKFNCGVSTNFKSGALAKWVRDFDSSIDAHIQGAQNSALYSDEQRAKIIAVLTECKNVSNVNHDSIRSGF